MEESPEIRSILMDTTVIKILRRSIHKFLKSYHHFTFTSLLLCLPFSASILLSQALVPTMSPLLLPVHSRLQSFFDPSGFMPSSQFFSPFNLKLSQAISASLFTLPFNLSFFLLSKASAIQSLKSHNADYPSLSSTCLVSFLSQYKKIFLTHVSNSFIILSINLSGFLVLLLVFHCIDAYGFISPNFFLSVFAAGVVIQSVVVANAFITCNLALAVAGMESSCGGYLAVFKACQLIRGRASTALFLALPVNLGFSALEVLFQRRVVRGFHLSDKITCSMTLEGLLIAYLHSLLIVVDTIITCMLYKSCKSEYPTYGETSDHYRIEHHLHLEGADGRSANARAMQLPIMA